MNYLKLTLIFLAFFMSVAFAQQSILKHDMRHGDESIFTIGKNNFISIKKVENSYRAEIIDSSQNRVAQIELPWSPTHVETFGNIERSLIGSLNKNGFNGDNGLVVLEGSGLIKSFTNVVDYGATNSDGGFFVITDEQDSPILTSFDRDLTKISSRKLSSDMVKRSLISVSKDGQELVISSPSPDISSRESITKYSGYNFSVETKYEFSGTPLFQAVSFGDNSLAINVNGALIAFSDKKVIWTYEPKPYFRVNALSTSQDKQHLIVKGDTGQVALLRSNGVEVFRENNKGGSVVYVNDNVAVVTNQQVARKFSLSTGKKIQESKLNDTDKVVGISHDAIYTSNKRGGELKELKKIN
jgi:hypothetical protein